MAAPTPRQLAAVLVDATHDKTPNEVNDVVAAFVALLAQRRLLPLWRAVERELHAVWKARYGASQVTIVSAHALTDLARQTIAAAAPGADISERVDPRLMAGAVVRIDDRRIDGSLAGRIARLQKALQTSSV